MIIENFLYIPDFMELLIKIKVHPEMMSSIKNVGGLRTKIKFFFTDVICERSYIVILTLLSLGTAKCIYL